MTRMLLIGDDVDIAKAITEDLRFAGVILV